MTEKLRPHQHGVTLPYGHRVAALGFMEALNMAMKTCQFWLCPDCDNINHCQYSPDEDDGSIGYTCNFCSWDGSSNDLMLGRTT